MKHRHKRLTSQAGSATVETVLVTPVMIWFMLTLVGMGRIALASQSVSLAAANGARAASLARTQEAAGHDARAVVDRTLAEERFSCSALKVDVAVEQLGAQVGQNTQVAVKVTCNVDLGDITGFSALPGTFTTTETWTSPVDTYRGE